MLRQGGCLSVSHPAVSCLHPSDPGLSSFASLLPAASALPLWPGLPLAAALHFKRPSSPGDAAWLQPPERLQRISFREERWRLEGRHPFGCPSRGGGTHLAANQSRARGLVALKPFTVAHDETHPCARSISSTFHWECEGPPGAPWARRAGKVWGAEAPGQKSPNPTGPSFCCGAPEIPRGVARVEGRAAPLSAAPEVVLLKNGRDSSIVLGQGWPDSLNKRAT